MSRRLLHLDAFSGAAGNMFMGAMLHLGLPRARLLEGLAPLGLDFKLIVRKVQRSGLAALHVDVLVPEVKRAPRGKTAASPRSGRKSKPVHRAAADHPHLHTPAQGVPSHAPSHSPLHGHAHGRRYAEIRRLIERARLAPNVKPRALAIFEALGRAEARVHGIDLDDVHFHEVGAVDAIVDVAAAAIALDLLAIDRVTCSPVALGYGTVESAHGRLPLPAPATLELLAGIPTVPAHVAWETVTPTGAAILRTIVDEFGVLPAMTVERVGYGAGNDRPGALPNVLRAVLGRGDGLSGDRIAVIETNLDDFVPEHFDYLMERLFEAGALDVSLQHLQMKKNRPGFLLRVLARPADRDALARIVFAESTAIGVRTLEWDRLVLERESARLATPFGAVRVKVVRGLDGRRDYSPEYDDCKRVARKTGVPLREVVERVLQQARAELGK
jgi:pyridinium-3,5-bisthiocarboxylic acid mononucleotide nickel chelatase